MLPWEAQLEMVRGKVMNPEIRSFAVKFQRSRPESTVLDTVFGDENRRRMESRRLKRSKDISRRLSESGR